MLRATLSELSPLLSKPYGTNVQNTFIHSNGAFRLRSLEPETDQALVGAWTARAYARRYWGKPLSAEAWRADYVSALNHPRQHSFIGLIDAQPVCQIDLYGVQGSVLSPYVPDAGPQDAGLHLLMAPPRSLRRGWSALALGSFARYFFGRCPSATLYAEPDATNLPAIRLALGLGFRQLGLIDLPEKRAALLSSTAADLR